MATLHVRDVPDRLYKRVHKLAAAKNRSLSAEVITLLDQAIREEERRIVHSRALSSLAAKQWRPPKGAMDSITSLREDRQR